MANIINGENRYSLKQNEIGEWHIFPAKRSERGCVLLSETSICGHMHKDEKVVDHTCLTDEDMRKLCYEKGRGVCGTCVSHLYETLSDDQETIMGS